MGPSLSRRLRAVAGLVPACRRVVDVGTDHALLPLALLAEGRCEAAVARDLRPGPIAVARRNVARSGFGGSVVAEVADGLDGLPLDGGDVVVVAGLGGLETADILERSLDAVRRARAVVLQPMKSLAELRSRLQAMDLAIEEEALAHDAGRHYVALRCRALRADEAPPAPLDALELLLGRELLARRPPGFRDYAAAVRRRLEKEARGLAGSDAPEDAEAVAARRASIARIDALHYTE